MMIGKVILTLCKAKLTFLRVLSTLILEPHVRTYCAKENDAGESFKNGLEEVVAPERMTLR